MSEQESEIRITRSIRVAVFLSPFYPCDTHRMSRSLAVRTWVATHPPKRSRKLLSFKPKRIHRRTHKILVVHA